MNFSEAYKEMLKGKRIKRKNFKGYWFIDKETGVAMIHLANNKDISYGKLGLTMANCAENDWEVCDCDSEESN